MPRGPSPLTAVPQKTAMDVPQETNMKAKILTFSSHGDTTLLEYDPATADMDEVNRVIAEYRSVICATHVQKQPALTGFEAVLCCLCRDLG